MTVLFLSQELLQLIVWYRSKTNAMNSNHLDTRVLKWSWLLLS